MADTPNMTGARLLPPGLLPSGLLPAGLSDLMPDQARREAMAITSLMESFGFFGYSPVDPPLVEFEDTLLADGPGAALAPDCFRLMDPQSSRMMALRADMTAQIARIASTRMAHWPRPLRLSYNGAVLRVRGEALNPERQLTQVGAEMIGATSPANDAELAVAALMALDRAGVNRLTIDLGVPRLLEAIYGDDIPPAALVEAVNAKDHALVRDHAADHAALLSALLDIPLGGVDGLSDGLSKIKSSLPEAAVAMLAEVLEVAALIRDAMPDVSVTVDPLEQRGFDYHHGIGFAIFAPGIKGELGRGGRYRTASGNGIGEESTGVTLYLERVLRALPPLRDEDRLYIPFEDGLNALAGHVRQDRAAILGTSQGSEAERLAEARSLGCSHWLKAGSITPISE